LQVALKTGNIAIANYLLDRGADVNFIEDESCCNAWRTPVLHDAINCAVMCCRWNTNDKYMGFRVFSTKERAVEALNVLKRMLDMGADVNALDSYGNSGMNRFALQAKQILPSYNYVEHSEGTDRVFTEELHEDLRNVLQALKISSETCNNAVIAAALDNARKRVTDGTTISGPLASSGVFPKMMTDMLAVGEQAGDMASSLEHIGKRYQKDMDRNIASFTNALEPLLIVMIAGVVGFVAIAILMAVFKVSSSLA
jgi:hypothetical protein